jgi:Arc/MetJ-type ribon-helix-helix transcriptional regulator
VGVAGALIGREEPIYRTLSRTAEMTAPPPTGTAPRLVRVPEEVARAVEERIRGSSFSSVDAFVSFVLARLLEKSGDAPFSEADEKALKDRLRSLGYID